MRSVGASHIGKVRTENQDRIFFHDQPVGNLKGLFFCSGKICRIDRRIRTDRPD